MNQMKKLLSLFFSILLISAISSPAFATTETTVTQFSYTIIDADGNIKTSGVTPNLAGRYSWSGITLENGDIVYFQKSDGSNFYILNNKRVTITMEKDRAGWLLFEFYNARNSTSDGGTVLDYLELHPQSCTRTFLTPESTPSFWYTFSLMNISSDPIKLTNITLTF